MDLRPRSIGELLDRAVTLGLRNVLPLCVIAAAVLLAQYLVQEVLDAFVYPWLLPIPVDSSRPVAAGEGRYALNVIAGFAVSGIGVMASAVVIEESVRNADSDVRSAINEAFTLSGTGAVPVFPAVIPLLLVHGLIFANLLQIDASPLRHLYVAYTVRSLLLDLSDLVYAAVTFVLGVVWVHTVLRVAEFSPVELLRSFVAPGFRVRAALYVLATFGLTEIPPSAAYLVQRLAHSHTGYLGTYYLLSMLGIALFSVLVTLIYLDQSARLAGLDIAEDLAKLTEVRGSTS